MVSACLRRWAGATWVAAVALAASVSAADDCGCGKFEGWNTGYMGCSLCGDTAPFEEDCCERGGRAVPVCTDGRSGSESTLVGTGLLDGSCDDRALEQSGHVVCHVGRVPKCGEPAIACADVYVGPAVSKVVSARSTCIDPTTHTCAVALATPEKSFFASDTPPYLNAAASSRDIYCPTGQACCPGGQTAVLLQSTKSSQPQPLPRTSSGTTAAGATTNKKPMAMSDGRCAGCTHGPGKQAGGPCLWRNPPLTGQRWCFPLVAPGTGSTEWSCPKDMDMCTGGVAATTASGGSATTAAASLSDLPTLTAKPPTTKPATAATTTIAAAPTTKPPSVSQPATPTANVTTSTATTVAPTEAPSLLHPSAPTAKTTRMSTAVPTITTASAATSAATTAPASALTSTTSTAGAPAPPATSGTPSDGPWHTPPPRTNSTPVAATAGAAPSAGAATTTDPPRPTSAASTAAKAGEADAADGGGADTTETVVGVSVALVVCAAAVCVCLAAWHRRAAAGRAPQQETIAEFQRRASTRVTSSTTTTNAAYSPAQSSSAAALVRASDVAAGGAVGGDGYAADAGHLARCAPAPGPEEPVYEIPMEEDGLATTSAPVYAAAGGVVYASTLTVARAGTQASGAGIYESTLTTARAGNYPSPAYESTLTMAGTAGDGVGGLAGFDAPAGQSSA